MSETPNDIILEFFDALPRHTQEIASVLCGLMIDSEAFFGPDVDVRAQARAHIDPSDNSAGKRKKVAAAVLWCGLFDHHFTITKLPPSSEEMHEIVDTVEAETGMASDLRDSADEADQRREDYVEASTKWAALRSSILSPLSIKSWQDEQKF